MKKISPGYIVPSAALTVNRKLIKRYSFDDKKPEAGDLAYGKVVRIGHHTELENKWGRIHRINDGTKAVFVFGNRYAPDAYEGLVPESMETELDVLARSGIVGVVKNKNSLMKDPTRIKVLGYVCDADGKVINTKNYCMISPKTEQKKNSRAKMILMVGTAMNSGKSASAAACCWALSTMGYDVRASKVTGTACLKDILYMQDAGASIISDFSYFGFPSTYLLDDKDVFRIFNHLDLKYANNSKNYWVVELADGVLQRETSMLLQSNDVKSRIHRLVFAAHDAFSVVGGLDVLKKKFNLIPDAISGICSNSPLAVKEFREFTDVPVFNNLMWDLKVLSEILI